MEPSSRPKGRRAPRTLPHRNPDPQTKHVYRLRNRALTDNDTKAKNLIRILEVAHDIDANFMREISSRSAELRAQRAQLEQDLAAAQVEIDH